MVLLGGFGWIGGPDRIQILWRWPDIENAVARFDTVSVGLLRNAGTGFGVIVQNRDVEPMNNGSERALRPCAVCRKITNGFCQEWSPHFNADVRSIIDTARRRSIRAIDAVHRTLNDEPLHLSKPAAA